MAMLQKSYVQEKQDWEFLFKTPLVGDQAGKPLEDIVKLGKLLQWKDRSMKKIDYSEKRADGVLFTVEGSPEWYFARKNGAELKIWRHVGKMEEKHSEELGTPKKTGKQIVAKGWKELFHIPPEKLDSESLHPYLLIKEEAEIGWIGGEKRKITFSRIEDGEDKIYFCGVWFRVEGSDKLYFGSMCEGGIKIWEFEGSQSDIMPISIKDGTSRWENTPGTKTAENHPLRKNGGLDSREKFFGETADPGGKFFEALEYYFPNAGFTADEKKQVGDAINAAARNSRARWWDSESYWPIGSVHETLHMASTDFLRNLPFEFETPGSVRGSMMEEGATDFLTAVYAGYAVKLKAGVGGMLPSYFQTSKAIAMLIGSGAFSINELLAAKFLGKKNNALQVILDYDSLRRKGETIEKFIVDNGYDLDSGQKFFFELFNSGFFLKYER